MEMGYLYFSCFFKVSEQMVTRHLQINEIFRYIDSFLHCV